MRSLLLIAMIMTGCGSDGGSKGSNAPETTESEDTQSIYSMALDSASELPECNDDNANQLVYVKDESQFYECDSGNWASIDINGKDGQDAGLDETYYYAVTTHASSQDVVEGSGEGYIGNIEVAFFKDDTAHVSISGTMGNSDSTGDTFTYDFAHSFYVKSDQMDGEVFAEKMGIYVDLVALYEMDLNKTPPEIHIKVDSDGTLNSAGQITFELESAD